LKISPHQADMDDRVQAGTSGLHPGWDAGFWRDLWRWLLIVPFVMVALFLTSNLALAVDFTLDPVSNRSALTTDYSPWDPIVILGVSDRIVIEMIDEYTQAGGGLEEGLIRYEPPSDVQEVFFPAGSEATKLPKIALAVSPTLDIPSTLSSTQTSTPIVGPATNTMTVTPTELDRSSTATPTPTQLPTASQTQSSSPTPTSTRTPNASYTPTASITATSSSTAGPSNTPTPTQPVSNLPECGQLRVYENLLDGNQYFVEVNNRNAEWSAFLTRVRLQWENDDADLDKMDWDGWVFWDDPGALNDKEIRTINNWSQDPELAPGLYKYWGGSFTPGPVDNPGTWYELDLTFEFRYGAQVLECTVAASNSG